ncbi:MAG: sigma-70 family RNA polymerase sigma factor [Ignavibacteriaceae bacterium]
MMLSQEDKILSVRIANGDTEAENLLFNRFSERTRLLVSIRLRGKASDDEQKDIISEINQAVLDSLRKGFFKPDYQKPLEAYIVGIATNIVGQFFRKQKKGFYRVRTELSNKIQDSGNVLNDIIDTEEKSRLRVCLKKLKPKYLEILILRFYEDKSIEEIANTLNLEHRRVSERINYALKLLLKEIKADKYFQ